MRPHGPLPSVNEQSKDATQVVLFWNPPALWQGFSSSSSLFVPQENAFVMFFFHQTKSRDVFNFYASLAASIYQIRIKSVNIPSNFELFRLLGQFHPIHSKASIKCPWQWLSPVFSHGSLHRLVLVGGQAFKRYSRVVFVLLKQQQQNAFSLLFLLHFQLLCQVIRVRSEGKKISCRI